MFYALSETARAKPPPPWLACLLLLLIGICSISCGPRPKPSAPILVHTLRCLDKPPPRIPLAEIGAGILEAGCPAGYLCLSVPARVAWGGWTGAIAEWAAEAWASCGPLPERPSATPPKET